MTGDAFFPFLLLLAVSMLVIGLSFNVGLY